MVKDIIHDPIFLGIKSVPATQEDLPIAIDLLDTLKANQKKCVGMAANMIGVSKRIIVVYDDSGVYDMYRIMINPEIVAKSSLYETKEACLSLLGGKRPTKRYKTIKVSYLTEEFKPCVRIFTGYVAQIIQHEIDHLNGVLI